MDLEIDVNREFTFEKQLRLLNKLLTVLIVQLAVLMVMLVGVKLL